MDAFGSLEGFQRVGFLVVIPRLLRDFGADPIRVLATAGLDANALDHPEKMISYRAMGMLVEAASKASQCPHFGLEIGKHINMASLGLVGQMMRNAPTVRQSLQDFVANQHHNAHGGVAYFTESEPEGFFGYAVYLPDVKGRQHIYDGAALAAFRLVRELVGPQEESGFEVLLARSLPDDVKPYREAFSGATLHFDALETAVIVPRALLSRRVAGADAKLHHHLKKRLTAPLPDVHELDLLARLRREVMLAILHADTSVVTIAGRLGTNRRTLHRRLQDRGTNFQEIRDEIRYELTRQLIVNTELDLQKITKIIGYADPSIFTKRFTQWDGITPSTWRENNRI